MTMTREVKWSNLGKEIVIGILFLLFLLIILLISMNRSNENINDLDLDSALFVIIIIYGSQLYRWSVWKLAGGFK